MLTKLRAAPRTYVNLLIVMLLGGLWHGAYYTFIAWGALHGIALAVERALGMHTDLPADGTPRTRPGQTPGARSNQTRWRGRGVRAAWFFVVQAIVLVAWVFFRSATFEDATAFLRNLATFDFGPLPAWALAGSLFLLPLVALHIWTWLLERST